MNRPSSAREALIAEALGDVAQLLDRVETVVPALEAARQALMQAGLQLAGRLGAFEGRMAALTENAKTQAVQHIVRRTNELARQSLDAQTRAMSEAAQTLFRTEAGPALQRLAVPLQQLVERVDRPWVGWLTHAATAACASALTFVLTVYLRVP